MIWMWNAFHRGFEPQQRHYIITRAQVYPKIPQIPPILHWRNSIRVDPYAHPQHIKAQKHFAYMIWMWDAVIGGLVGLTTDETARIPTKNPCLLVKECPPPKVY